VTELQNGSAEHLLAQLKADDVGGTAGRGLVHQFADLTGFKAVVLREFEAIRSSRTHLMATLQAL
jgi:hypothetical protein